MCLFLCYCLLMQWKNKKGKEVIFILQCILMIHAPIYTIVIYYFLLLFDDTFPHRFTTRPVLVPPEETCINLTLRSGFCFFGSNFLFNRAFRTGTRAIAVLPDCRRAN